MKKIDANELYKNLSGFLSANGIELKEGAYSERIRQGCNSLTEVINTTQSTVARARDTVDRGFDQLRQTIHNATAPRSARAAGTPPPAGSAPRSARRTGPTRPSASAKTSAKSPRTARRK